MSSRPHARRRVVLIGLDAAEHSVVQSMVARGRLPALARLLQQGTAGTLDSPAHLYSGAVWPTFYTGQRPAWHGIYHNKLWRPERMCCVVPDARTFPARPFWEAFGRHGLRSCVIDVPLVLGVPDRFEGLYLGGWGTHDTAPIESHPRRLVRDLRRRFGRTAMPRENFGRQTLHGLTSLAGDLLDATGQLQRLSAHLLQLETWDFACVVFGATHRAGHYLWDHGEAADAPRGAAPPPDLAEAVERVYASTDAAVGELLAACGDETLVIVFSLHGMEANRGWSEVVPAMLAARATALSQRPSREGLLYSLRRSLVTRLRPVLQHVPPSLAAQLVPLWSARMSDWQNTRAFPLPMDLNAFLRVNLRGRERDGIVDPGSEYEAVCEELVAFFGSLRDAATGRPIVAEVDRTFARTPPEAPQRLGLPDLIVRWQDLPTREVARLASTLLPSFDCTVPELLPSGRSGNHRPLGWFVARGPGIPPGGMLPTRDILDLAPTVRHHLGLVADPSLHGTRLPLGDLAP